jgi:hypothetical protein
MYNRFGSGLTSLAKRVAMQRLINKVTENQNITAKKMTELCDAQMGVTGLKARKVSAALS